MTKIRKHLSLQYTLELLFGFNYFHTGHYSKQEVYCFFKSETWKKLQLKKAPSHFQTLQILPIFFILKEPQYFVVPLLNYVRMVTDVTETRNIIPSMEFKTCMAIKS